MLYLDLIFYKVYAELRAEASRAYLGLLWWVLEPVLYMAAFYVVFGVIFQRGGEDFVVYLLCGLVPWKWFDASVKQASNSIGANRALMQQVYLPKLVFPTVVVLSNSVKFLVVLLLLLGFLVVYGVPLQPTWLALPAVVLTQLLVIVAVGTALAAVVPFFPDLKIIIANGLMLLLFLSGIFFTAADVPESLRFYFFMNPMAVLIDAYRAVLIEGAWPDFGRMGVVAVCSVIVLGWVWRMFMRFDRVYPKVVI